MKPDEAAIDIDGFGIKYNWPAKKVKVGAGNVLTRNVLQMDKVSIRRDGARTVHRVLS